MSQLAQIMKGIKPETYLKWVSRYKTYVKFAAPAGVFVGVGITYCYVEDMKDEGIKLRRSTKFGLYTTGVIGGAALGVTAPAWIFFLPVGAVFGFENVGTVAKGILALALAADSN